MTHSQFLCGAIDGAGEAVAVSPWARAEFHRDLDPNPLAASLATLEDSLLLKKTLTQDIFEQLAASDQRAGRLLIARSIAGDQLHERI